MKKKKAVLIAIAIFMTIIGINACGGGNNENENNDTEKGIEEVIFNLLDNQVVIDIYVHCLSNVNGKIADPVNGTILYLHSMILNHINSCNDIIAEGTVYDNWVTFVFENPGNSNGILDRFWSSNKKECNPSTEEWWMCIPEADVNPFYREDCSENPGIEAVFWEDKTTIVPPETPCDTIGGGCV